MAAGRLTERERDVLALMADGLTNRQIAGRLSLEQSTIRWYTRQIYSRLGADNRQEAIARAHELGLVTSAEPPAQPPHNLPASLTPFVGRVNELARLNELLADQAVRLVTIVGPGGMGKTRLALAAAEAQLQTHPDARRRHLDRYPDGIWFIPLAAVGNPRDLAANVASTLGLQLKGETGRAPFAQLADYLRQKRALLVMDNFEHLVEEAAFLATIAAEARGIQLLVTSRERLQLPGEQVLSLDGLPVPSDIRITLATLNRYDAPRLFLSAARRVQPELALSEADASYVARICRAVVGMPLGIELAASWASVLPLGELAQDIEGSLDLLAADRRGVPERHRSMQAALDASWQRLTPSQHAGFMQLCVFRGGFTRPAAFEVAGTTLPLLVTLFNKSWLTYDPRGDRYDIHELLRQYGRRKLAAEPDPEQAACVRHSAFYATRLHHHAPDFTSSRQLDWVTEMQVELANIEQAWSWAVKAGDVEKIGQSVESLARFYSWTGRLSEGEAALRGAAEQVASLARAHPSRSNLTRLCAVVLIWQSRLTIDRKRRLELLEEVQALLERLPADELDLRLDRAFLLVNLADGFSWVDPLQADDFYERALELYRGLGDRAGMAACLHGLGAIDWARGQLDQAAQQIEASLAIRREMEDQRGVAGALSLLALVRKHQGQTEAAERLHRQVVASYRRMGSRLDELTATGNLAKSMAATGRYDEMLDVAQRAMALARELGEPDLAYHQNTLAVALKNHGRYREARAVLLEAATTAHATGTRQTLYYTLCWLGQIEYVAGDYVQAEQLLTESSEIFAELHRKVAGIPAAWLAYTYRAQGNADRAARQLSLALQLTHDRRTVLSLYDCLPVAALLAADRGNLERAAELHAFCQTFPMIANSRFYYDAAGRQLDEISARLPAKVATAATERGRKLDLWETAEALAAELTSA